MDNTPLFGVPMSSSSDGSSDNAPITKVDNGLIGSLPTPRVKDGKHSGFAGVARDILGTLGDFLLTRLHMPAMYAPAQKNRQLSEAQIGIDSDPAAAIRRVTEVDPVFGAKLRDQYIDNGRLAATQASTAEARAQRIENINAVKNDRTRNRVGAMLDSMGQWDPTKRTTDYPLMRSQALKYAQANGLDLSTELPESYDPTILDSFIDGAVPAGTQRAQRLSAARAAVAERQGDARIGVAKDRNDISRTQGDRRLDIADRAERDRTTLGRDTNDIRRSDPRRVAPAPKPAPKATPTGADIAYLRAHPEVRDPFDGKFGLGASRKVLGN